MFREARPGDFPGVIRLYRQLHPQDPVLTDGSDEAVFNRILETTGLHLFVLEKGGAVVASTYLNIVLNISRSASPYAIIENVVVDEAWRGTGLGKQIMAGTIQAAWDAGFESDPNQVGQRPSRSPHQRRRLPTAARSSARARSNQITDRGATPGVGHSRHS